MAEKKRGKRRRRRSVRLARILSLQPASTRARPTGEVSNVVGFNVVGPTKEQKEEVRTEQLKKSRRRSNSQRRVGSRCISWRNVSRDRSIEGQFRESC